MTKIIEKLKFRSDEEAYLITDAAAQTEISAIKTNKQDTLVSGTTIKTINGESLLGSGDISVATDTANLTVNSSIIPDTTQTYDLGSDNKRFRAIYADEAYLSTNTLYLGDTPVLGTTSNTINISADEDQSIVVKTTGGGSSQLVSDKSVDITSKLDNSSVNITAMGNNGAVNISGSKDINLTATNISLTGNTTIANLNVTGTTTTVNSQNLNVKDNLIEINSGETGSGVSAGTAGLKVNRGDLSDYRIVFDESDDMFKVGMVGDLETIASQNYVGTQLSSYATKTELDGKMDKVTLSTVATSGSYNALSNKPTIPTKVSELTNDSGFTTNTGTVTGIKMNGASKGTSGVVDLGTVITSTSDCVKFTNNTVTVAGTSKTVSKTSPEVLYAPNGLIMGGTALAAGLTTRGICGISTPTKTGACDKENLYINYDGNNTNNPNGRGIVLNAGVVGEDLGNGMRAYTVPRGDVVKAWVEAKGYITGSGSITGNAATATKATQDASGNVITTTYATKTDLGSKQDKLTAGNNITIENNVISASGGAGFDFEGTLAEYEAVQETLADDAKCFITDDSGVAPTSITSEQLNAKADLDLSNVSSNIDYVVETKLPTSLDPTWYRVYKSGWVEQGGIIDTYSTAGWQNGKVITLVKPMRDNLYVVSWENGWTSYTSGGTVVTDTTTTSFSISAFTSYNSSKRANWQVSGQGA